MEGPEKYYEFSPSDQRLIDVYLRSKIAGKDVGGGSIHDVDVTSDHPYNLVRKHAPAPAPGSLTGGGDKGVWFFFSLKRYVGNSKASARSGSRLRNRARTVLGVDGRKKGAWHTEGRKKTVPGSAGGYFQNLSYEEVTPSGSVVKPGWLMIEYAIEEEHGGGGAMVLCKVYKSPRGPGSDVPSLSRERKADVVEQPVVEQLQRPCKRTHREVMFLAGTLLCEDLTETDYPAAVPAAYQETERTLGRSGESATPADQCIGKTDQVPRRIQEDARDELTRFWESLATGHDEMALDYLLQDDDSEIEFTFEELMMGSSTPGGYSSMPSPRTLTDDDEDDDDDMRGLACPTMDYAILEALVELGPAIMEEEDFICDL